jgi:hypothetical protein
MLLSFFDILHSFILISHQHYKANKRDHHTYNTHAHNNIRP